jgi:hypothetical protein
MITQDATPKAYATGQGKVLLQSAARNQNLLLFAYVMLCHLEVAPDACRTEHVRRAFTDEDRDTQELVVHRSVGSMAPSTLTV